LNNPERPFLRARKRKEIVAFLNNLSELFGSVTFESTAADLRRLLKSPGRARLLRRLELYARTYRISSIGKARGALERLLGSAYSCDPALKVKERFHREFEELEYALNSFLSCYRVERPEPPPLRQSTKRKKAA